MDNILMNPRRRRRGMTALALILGSLLSSTAMAAPDRSVLNQSVMTTLEQCQQVSPSCGEMTKDAPGILVFPDVVKADLIVGGAGGKGALIENGKITGYYSIGAVSAGLQAGIENASQVYVFRTEDALNRLKQSQDWKVGASAGVTVVTADANASSSTGNILVYVFDSKGLNAGVSLDAFDVWQSRHHRPQS
jgi:lipid-binding SYLF domain-containing protein